MSPYATDWSAVGVDIPTRTTICATVEAKTYQNGIVDASAGIQAIINACPDGQVVLLGPGQFQIDLGLILKPHIVLRGSGPGVTTLVYLGEATNQHILLLGNMFPNEDETTDVNLAIDGVMGARSITLTNATGFAAGQIVKLDADEWTTATKMNAAPLKDGTPQQVFGTDRVTYSDRITETSLDDYSRYGRMIAEVKEIESVVGNTVTFTSPLHIDYPVSKASQLIRYTGPNVFKRDMGVEDLTVTGGTSGNIRITTAAQSWIKNVECSYFSGPCIDTHHSFRIEIRDSYIHHANNPVPGGGGYALSLRNGSSEFLIENSIIMNANKVLAARSGGAGTVVGYNFMSDAWIRYDATFMEVGINASHFPAPHSVLFEGNQSQNYDSDWTFGSSIRMTVFRNLLEGERETIPVRMGRSYRAAGLMSGSYWHAFIGNILGRPGITATKWIYDDPCDGKATTGQIACNVNRAAIFRLGYSSVNAQLADPKTRATAIREGNYDYLTNQVRWSSGPRTLPDSYYLSEKPAFFGDNPWPWVDPLNARLYTLPAKVRYDAMVKPSLERLHTIGDE